MKQQIWLNCSCGGGASVHVEADQKEAIAECACGKTLFWSSDPDKMREKETINSSDIGKLEDVIGNPPTLGISVGDDAKTDEKFG